MRALHDIKKQRNHTAYEVEKQKERRKQLIESAWELKKHIKKAEQTIEEYDRIIQLVEEQE